MVAGLNDFRVAYWEPVKWVSKIRHVLSTGSLSTAASALAQPRPRYLCEHPQPLILLKCKMDSGHGGSSARYTYIEEKALEYTFILDQLGLVQL